MRRFVALAAICAAVVFAAPAIHGQAKNAKAPTLSGGNGLLYIGTYKGEIEIYDEATEEIDAAAEAILAAQDPDGTDIWATLRWGGVRAANLFFGCGRPDAAREVLATVNRRVPPGQDMYAMAAIEAAFASRLAPDAPDRKSVV